MTTLGGRLTLAVLLSTLPLAAGAAEAPQKRVKVAVTDLKPLGSVDPKEIEGLTGIIAAGVNELKKFEVITRSDIQSMLGFEKERLLLGCSDASCLAEIGGAMGVDYLVASETSKIGSKWLVSFSLVEVRKGRSVNRLSKEAASSDALVSAIRSGTRELFAELLPVEAPPPAVATQAEPGKEKPSQTGSYLRWTGAGVGLLGGGALYGSSWLTYGEFDSPSGKQTVTLADAEAAKVRGGVGLGLAAVGAGLLAWELLASGAEPAAR